MDNKYCKLYLAFWFGFFAGMPFLALLLAFQKPFSHLPPGVFIWVFCVIAIAGFFGFRNGTDIFSMCKFNRAEYWVAAKKGMVIAAKTALASAIIISLFHPLLTPNKTELTIPMLMVFYLLYFLVGFLVFSWLILGFGAVSGVLLLFFRSLFRREES